jgi:hypothetical protein
MERDLYLHEFLPRPKLSVPATPIERPRFPVIDAHNHLGPDFGGGWSERPVAELLDALDQADVRVYVDLDGGWGEQILNQRLEHFKAAAPGPCWKGARSRSGRQWCRRSARGRRRWLGGPNTRS